MSEDMGPLSMHDAHSKPKLKRHTLLWIFLCLVVVIGTTLWFVRDMILYDSTGKQSVLPTEVMENSSENGAEISGNTPTDASGTSSDASGLSSDTTLAQLPKGDAEAQDAHMGILDMLDGGKKGATGDDALDPDAVLDRKPLLDADGTPILDANGNPMFEESSTEHAETVEETVEDAVVRAAFIEDFAPWLVSLYYPKGAHPEARKSGLALADISRINQRYGTKMIGLSWTGDSIDEGRTSVLEYIFAPAMIDSVYALYVDRFMASVAIAVKAPRADGVTLSEAQQKEMYSLYAQQMRDYANALDGIMRMSGLSRSVHAWQLTTDKALEANADFTDKLFAYESARDAGRTAEAAEARSKMDAAGKAYQQAIIMRERARETLSESLRSSVNARRLDESSLLYLATWVERRLDAAPQNKESLQAISLVLKNLATRFDAAQSPNQE